jgi:hypothetical protein
VELGEALRLRSSLHPRRADTTPIASSLTDIYLEGQALASSEKADVIQSSPTGSLTVQLMTNAATGQLRCGHMGRGMAAE